MTSGSSGLLLAKGVETTFPQQYSNILNEDCQHFLATLQRAFNPTRVSLLNKRKQQLSEPLHYLEETRTIREDPSWRAAPPAPGMADRRVEITGPISRKMVINALNAGSSTFMADFEDSTSPTWLNILEGHQNMIDANKRTISFKDPRSGKEYNLKPKIATLLIRPRGWHMIESHFLVDGAPMSASLFDFGVYFYHNAKLTIADNRGPYFYCPKMEHYLEARLWNDVFNLSQDWIGIPRGTIRATCLIETIQAGFQMEEIIYELREHSSGLNCGRWDYIFSFIKKFRNDPNFVLPDRKDVTMTTPFMAAYVRHLIKVCHRRGVHAMGGMAAQIPIKNDSNANAQAMEKVRRDKLREVQAGHDGTWVAHPDLVKVAKEIFDKYMPQPNQLYKQFDYEVTESQLIERPKTGAITNKGVVANCQIALLYMDAWLNGNGCVPIHNLMEDAATAEISRSQLYQWVRHQVKTIEGTLVTAELVLRTIDEQVVLLAKTPGQYVEAAKQLKGMITDFPDFISTVCYQHICDSSVERIPSAKL